MRRTGLIALAALLLASCAPKAQEPAAPQIIPLPAHLQMLEGSFTFGKDVPVWIDPDTEGLRRTVGFLSERFEAAAGWPLKVSDSQPAPDAKAIWFLQADGYPAEGYQRGAGPHPHRIQ